MKEEVEIEDQHLTIPLDDGGKHLFFDLLNLHLEVFLGFFLNFLVKFLDHSTSDIFHKNRRTFSKLNFLNQGIYPPL